MNANQLAKLSPLDLPDDIAQITVIRDGNQGTVAVSVWGSNRAYSHQCIGYGATIAAAHAAALDNKAADERKREAGLAWRKAA